MTNFNDGGSCTTASPPANSCQKELCQTGACINVADAGKVGQACAFGTPLTNAECQQKLCAADGTCPVTNFNEGGTCDNASPPANTCQKEICQSGVCNSVADAGQVGQACTFGTPLTNAECQQKLCAADGTCPVTNFNEGATCTTASPPANTCQKEICSSGACIDVGDQSKNGTACAFGTPPPECQHNVCQTSTLNGSATCVPVGDSSQNGNTCTTASPAANACQQEICQSGACNSVANAAVNGQGCDFGPTPGECQTDVCSNGACILANANEGGACTTASPPPTQCQEQICQSGACVDVAISPPPAQCGQRPIPTLSEWGMIMLGALLALVGFAAIRRREM